MPTFTKGSFSIDLTFEPLADALAEEDRQIAWELYVKIATRLELRQSPIAANAGVGAIEEFLAEARGLLARYPAGKTRAANHLGFFLALMLEIVVCPFLWKWRRAESAGDMSEDWRELSRFFEALIGELAAKYAFVDLLNAMPWGLQEAWGLSRE